MVTTAVATIIEAHPILLPRLLLIHLLTAHSISLSPPLPRPSRSFHLLPTPPSLAVHSQTRALNTRHRHDDSVSVDLGNSISFSPQKVYEVHMNFCKSERTHVVPFMRGMEQNLAIALHRSTLPGRRCPFLIRTPRWTRLNGSQGSRKPGQTRWTRKRQSLGNICTRLKISTQWTVLRWGKLGDLPSFIMQCNEPEPSPIPLRNRRRSDCMTFTARLDHAPIVSHSLTDCYDLKPVSDPKRAHPTCLTAHVPEKNNRVPNSRAGVVVVV